MMQPSDHPDSRLAILAAAKKLFSQRGYNGASIADIAREAEITKSLVMYHWPSKERLWCDVMNEALEPYMDLIDRFGRQDPGVTVEEIIRFAVTMHIDQPEIIRMWTWLSLDGQFLLDEEKACRGRLAIERVVAEASSHESEKPGLRPLMVLAISMAAIDGWFCYRDMISHITGLDTQGEEATSEFTEAVVKLFVPYLLPKKPESLAEGAH
jgi:TetR/AcrR family transcriptional regulator